MIRLELTSKYYRSLKSFVKGNKTNAKNLKKALRLFLDNPKHPGLNLEKLSNSKYWSVRIDRKNRLFFEWIDKETVLFQMECRSQNDRGIHSHVLLVLLSCSES